MKRDTRQAYRRRAADTERMVDQAVAEVKAERAAEWEAQKAAAAEARANRRGFDRDDLEGARAIRTRTGWWAVVRVNAATVTVDTGYSWTERVPFAKVLDVRL